MPFIEIRKVDGSSNSKFEVFDNNENDKINLNSLNKYIEIYTTLRHIENDENKYYKIPYRDCTEKDFNQREVEFP